MRILGLDVGEKRIGVARVDSSTRIAVPVTTVEVNGTEWENIKKLARLNNTSFFVLGLPRSNEGNETAQSAYVRRFAKTLSEKIPEAKIRFQDESLTSVVAEERLKKRKKKYEKGEIDAEAASIILQDFIETFKASAETKTAPKKTSSATTQSSTIKQTLDNVAKTTKNITKKETKKVALKTKKATFTLKKLGILSLSGILVIAGVVGGVIWYKDYRARERAEYFASLEAEMKPDVFKFTIVPGETIFDIKASLLEQGYSQAEIDEAFAADYDFDFLKDRPAGASLEGYLYGETHEFYSDATVKDIITKFLEGTEQVINENNLKEAYAARGLSLFDGITLASVVQKEAPSPEQNTVAQVFLSRLELGIPLGSDVTVSYALDVVDPKREIYQDNAAALLIDSCYNTRRNAGLPCGPISNPGISALLAVANPTDTAYLYFLTGDDGMMYYSYTESEHIQNANQHCQTLCNVSL